MARRPTTRGVGPDGTGASRCMRGIIDTPYGGDVARKVLLEGDFRDSDAIEAWAREISDGFAAPVSLG